MKRNIADIFFEAGDLRRIQRAPVMSPYLKTENVAEHTFRVSMIALYIAKKEGVDIAKTLSMAILHDIAETRTNDITGFQKDYVERNEEKAHGDIFDNVVGADFMKEIVDEYEERECIESKFVKDADRLELFMTELELADNGVRMAKFHADRMKVNLQTTLTTKTAKELCETIKVTEPNNFQAQVFLSKDERGDLG